MLLVGVHVHVHVHLLVDVDVSVDVGGAVCVGNTWYCLAHICSFPFVSLNA